MSQEFDPKYDPLREEDLEREDEAVWRLLSIYADGEATPEEAARVEALLQSDPATFRDLAFLRMAADSARSQIEVEPPERLRQAIFAATVHRPTLARRVATGWGVLYRALTSQSGRYALPAGALAAAGITALVLLPRVAAHRSEQVASTPIRQTGAAHLSRLVRHEVAGRPHAFQKPSELALISPGLLGAQEFMSAFLASPQSAPASPAIAEKPAGLRKVSQKTRPDVGKASDREIQPRSQQLVQRPSTGRRPSVSSPQPPGSLDHEPMQVATAYAFQPGMDIRDQHLRAAMETASNTLVGADVRVSSTDTAPAKPDAGPAPPQIHRGHLLVSELPLSPSPSLAEMKRGLMASTLGYDRETLEHIERHQAAVSLIGSRF